MTDPTLSKEIGAALIEAQTLAATVDGMGADLEALRGNDRVREMALHKLRGDWEFVKDRVHELANRFFQLQERHLTVVEGPPPPAEKERP